VLGASGAVTLNATTTNADALLGIEEYRGQQFDLAVPLGVAVVSLLSQQPQARDLGWLARRATLLAALYRQGQQGQNLEALDREHRHAHTHHISAFQQLTGDASMTLSPRPLRKWAGLVPLGLALAAMGRSRRNETLAAGGAACAAAGGVATLVGFRNGQRPWQRTVEGRARSWLIGLGGAVVVWALSRLWSK
jgi:uncharacterized membrane protein